MSAGTAIPEDRFREALARPRCWQAVADAFSCHRPAYWSHSVIGM